MADVAVANEETAACRLPVEPEFPVPDPNAKVSLLSLKETNSLRRAVRKTTK